LGDLDNISVHFKTILEMDATEFTVQVGDYIEAYDNALEQIPFGKGCSVMSLFFLTQYWFMDYKEVVERT